VRKRTYQDWCVELRFFFAKEAKDMELITAMKVIRVLHQERVPETEELLPPGSICTREDVREALQIALESLSWSVNEKLREAALPPNSGKPWTSNEDAQLAGEFDQSLAAGEIAIMHGRTKWAILKRLEHLGKIPPSEPSLPRAA
jgi:hypothetical protein